MSQPYEPRCPEPGEPRYPEPHYPAPEHTPPAATGPKPPPPPPAQPPRTHPHHMDFPQRRIHLSEHQRGADATAMGQLLLYVPSFLVSLALVAGLSYTLLPDVGWLLPALWLASGALAFHRPAESSFARHILGLRYPTPEELERLRPVWREVTARAGVDGSTYELWIEDSEDLNAYAAAGHIVGVTAFSLNRLPSGQLAAVLAHELGHHTGGHAWSSLLGYWYALPGRLAWAGLRWAARLALLIASHISLAATGILFLVLGGLLITFAFSVWFLVLPLVIAPYLLAAVGRRAELRADRHAAALGFAPMLAEVLHTLHADELEAARTAPASAMAGTRRPGLLTKLLSSHPEYHTRLHHLQPYLRPTR